MIRWAAGRPAVIWALGAALILAGAVAFTKLPLATRTAVELPRLTVNATWFGASPELVESYITSPIEEAIQGVRGVKKITSSSEGGVSRLTVELEPTADITLARLDINERLELLRSRFPLGVGGPSVANFVPEELEEQPLLTYSIVGPYTAGTLTKITNDQIIPRITAVPGVAGVRRSGTAEPGVAVVYEPLRLRQLGINPTLLRNAIAEARAVEALGRERRGDNVVTVALRDQPNALEDLGQLVVRAPSGRVFRLDELATIRPDE
ncbi:MAG: efflux RND transporter permease subunit, partial [Gemmatimonadales bacterium]